MSYLHCLLALILCALPLSGMAENSLVHQRNSIEAGDNTLNLIATTGAEIVVILESGGAAKSVSKSKFLKRILEQDSTALDKASNALPNQAEQVVNELAVAQHLFSIGQYSSSAHAYQSVLNSIGPDNPRFLEIQGMVTASFFGSSRHLEGLKFICRQYEALPPNDARFRHAIHAHLRSLAVNLGHAQARKILEHVREVEQCNRQDMSPIWIPIHLRDMRDLENSVSPIGGVYGIRNQADLEFAEELLKEGEHGFQDYLHFAMRDYETVVRNYPHSLVYDLALIGAGETSNYESAVLFLREYISKYDRHRTQALHTLYLRMVRASDFQSVAALLDEFSQENFVTPSDHGSIFFQVNGNTRVWLNSDKIGELSIEQVGLISEFYSECRTLEALANTPKGFPHFVERLGIYGERFGALFPDEIELSGWFGQRHELEYSGKCAFELRGRAFVEFSELFSDERKILLGEDQAEIRRVAKEFKNCGDYRQGYRKGPLEGLKGAPYEFCTRLDQICSKLGQNHTCSAISLQKLSAALLEMLYEKSFHEAKDDLFLAALAHRNSHDYLEYALGMEQYSSLYPQGDFADDALTELGWYYMEVTGDYDKSERALSKVIEEYSDKNAYDNALNWMVLLKLKTFSFGEAAYWSSRLVAEVTSSRIGAFAGSRNEAIEEIAQQHDGNANPDLFVVSWRSRSLSNCYNVIINSSEEYGIKGFGDYGAYVCSVDGASIHSPLELYRMLAKASLQGRKVAKVGIRPFGSSGSKTEMNLPLTAFGFAR